MKLRIITVLNSGQKPVNETDREIQRDRDTKKEMDTEKPKEEERKELAEAKTLTMLVAHARSTSRGNSS